MLTQARRVQDTKALLEIEIAEANQAVHTLQADVKELAQSLAQAKHNFDGAKKAWREAERELNAMQRGAPLLGLVNRIPTDW